MRDNPAMEHDTVILNFHKGIPALKEAFECLGYKVAENQWRPAPELLARSELCLVNLYDAIRSPWVTFSLKRCLRHLGIPLIGLDRDAPWHMGIRWRRLALFRLLRPLDILASHSMQPSWQFANAKLYCPNAARTSLFNLGNHTLAEMRNPSFYLYDVSFIGNLDGQRYREHRTRAEFFAALSGHLSTLEIRHCFTDANSMSLDEQIELIQRSRINLTFGAAADHGGTRSWGLPERCYGVPACGGFLLADERLHASDDFDLKSEWASFTNIEDCLEKIRYWLNNFEQARRIAEAAHAKVMRRHTYEHRARHLIQAAQTHRGI